MDSVDDQSGAFASLPPAAQAISLENGRVLPLMLKAPPPPRITCEQLGKVSSRVTVARGELTRLLYRIATDTASRCIPGSRLVIVPGARHLWPARDPAAFDALSEASLGNP